jgi:hypothetical protein
MRRSKKYLTWMENPLIANEAELFRIIGDIKIFDLLENGTCLGKKYIYQQDRLFILHSLGVDRASRPHMYGWVSS